ncbi:MAG TPA: VOC family protein [Chitinophagaceae bacterium]
MEGIIPYLNFEGNGTEALQFYSKALDGKVLFQQTFGDSPMGAQTPDEFKNRLMHASFQCDAGSFMASDGPPGYELKAGNNVSLSLHYNSIEKIEKAFNGLAEGGTVMMPLQETFWAHRFGMLIDKYGFNWMFNMDKPQQ